LVLVYENQLESLCEFAIHVCRRTEQTREEESEAPIDDGHQWRKYGQKEILNAKFPRYRYMIILEYLLNKYLSTKN